jgi:hypothetical protein
VVSGVLFESTTSENVTVEVGAANPVVFWKN